MYDSKNAVLSKLKELKPRLEEEFAVYKIGVFGSFAMETHSQDSDIDILIEFKKPIGWKFFTLELFLEGIFGRKIDLVTRNALKQQIRDSILQQVSYVE